MKKRWKELVRPGSAYHVSAALDERRMPIPLHDHDFAEIMWVVQGSGVHRINGRRQEIHAGRIVFVRPSDRHGLDVVGDGCFRLENVAFPQAVRWRFEARYGGVDRRALPWAADSDQPPSQALNADQLRTLSDEIDWLRTAPRDAFSLDCFLLNLARLLGSAPRSAPMLPDWLNQALRRFDAEASMSDGVESLFRLAGRSPEHVARTMRRHLGSTPTEWVNARRLDHAARLTESTMLPIIEIAAECGFENLGHFHRLFRARHGTTPLRHRSENRAVM